VLEKALVLSKTRLRAFLSQIMHTPSSSSHHHHFTASLSPPPPPNLTSPSPSSVSSNLLSSIRSVKPLPPTSKTTSVFNGILCTENSIFKKFRFQYKRMIYCLIWSIVWIILLLHCLRFFSKLEGEIEWWWDLKRELRMTYHHNDKQQSVNHWVW